MCHVLCIMYYVAGKYYFPQGNKNQNLILRGLWLLLIAITMEMIQKYNNERPTAGPCRPQCENVCERYDMENQFPQIHLSHLLIM